MNKTTLILSASACGVILFAAGILAGRAFPEKKEKTAVPEPLFDVQMSRQGADYMDEMLQRVRTQADMNLCAATGTTLRQAELYAFFREYLNSLPENRREAALLEQKQWEEEYFKVLKEPSDYEGGSLAPFDRSMRAGTLLFDRLRYLHASPEAKEAYGKMKNFTFTDMDKIERRLSNGQFRGVFRDGERDIFKLTPELCLASGGFLAGEIVCSPAGKQTYRMIVVWKDGKVKEKIAVAGDKHVDSVRISDGRLLIGHTDISGKKGTLSVGL